MDRKSMLSGKSLGFNLLELMLVITITGIVLLLISPAMWRIIQINRLQTETNRLVTAINFTRSEAVLRNIAVSMCPSSTLNYGETVCSGSYADGWFVFTNRDRDRIVDDGVDKVLLQFDRLPNGYTLTNRAGTRAATEIITYYPDGSSPRNRTLLLCPPGSGKRDSLSVVLNTVGRPRIDRTWGECPSP